jgi:phage terminase large subunit-like protein
LSDLAAWNLSCPDWEDRIREGRSLIPDLPLNRDEADEAVAFFDQLQLPDVAGHPPLSEAAGEWARDIVRATFGSWFPEVARRYIEEVFALIGKKNSKTSYLGAALMLTALFMNRRPRAEFLFAGPTQGTADLAYSQADGMIRLNPELEKRFKPRNHIKEIQDLDLGAKLKIKTFDLKALTGPRPAGAFIDELHLLTRNPHTAQILRQLRGGRQSIPEAFMIIATTQADEPPVGAFREELMAARAIRDGKRGGTMLPVLYEFPDAIARDRERWSDPANWPMVMPNLGRSLRLDSLIRDYEAQREKGEWAGRLWASQHLNIEIGIGLRGDPWGAAEYWPGRADASLSLETLIERSEVITVAVDGGGQDDLLSLCAMGREPDSRHWLAWHATWMHRKVLDLRKSEATRLLDFERAGELVIVDSMAAAYAQLAGIVATIAKSGLIPEIAGKLGIGFDPMGVGMIIDALAAAGVVDSDDQVWAVPQGWMLNGAIKTVEVKLADGELTHAGQGVTAWAMGNVKIEAKGNAITITKQVSGTGKIDPVMALVMAGALMSRNPEASGGSYLEEEALMVI